MPRSRVTALLLTLALASPARAHPGSGIVVDRSGNVYFVVLGSNAIMRVGRDGKAVPFVTDERLRLPHHLVLGRDGSIYVASDHDGVVWRVDAAGSLHEHFNSSRTRQRDPGAQVSIGSGGDPFTVDSAGNVYALAAPAGSAIVRIASDGKVTPVTKGVPLSGLHFSSMSWGGDGALYVTDANRVWRLKGDSATAILPRGMQLSAAAGVAVDRDGNIYVADYRGGRVMRFAVDGAVNTPRALERASLRNPTGVTAGGGAVYVLDSPPGGVAIWRVQGDEAERLYSKMGAAVYLRWAFPGVLVFLVVLVVLNSVLKSRAKRRAGAHPVG